MIWPQVWCVHSPMMDTLITCVLQSKNGLGIAFDPVGDGNCLFRAIASQWPDIWDPLCRSSKLLAPAPLLSLATRQCTASALGGRHRTMVFGFYELRQNIWWPELKNLLSFHSWVWLKILRSVDLGKYHCTAEHDKSTVQCYFWEVGCDWLVFQRPRSCELIYG